MCVAVYCVCPSSFTTVPVCIPPSCVARPSFHSGLDLQGNRTQTQCAGEISYSDTCVSDRVKENGCATHRSGCPQSRWPRRCLAAYPEPGLSSVRTAGAGSGRRRDGYEELGKRIRT